MKKMRLKREFSILVRAKFKQHRLLPKDQPEQEEKKGGERQKRSQRHQHQHQQQQQKKQESQKLQDLLVPKEPELRQIK